MLLHIQSIKDVEFFGINSSNYGKFVLDTATWEARYGLSVATLERAELAAVVTPGADGTRVVPTVAPEDATLTRRQRRSGQPSRRSDEMPAPTRTAEPPRLVSTPTPTPNQGQPSSGGKVWKVLRGTGTPTFTALTKGEGAVLRYKAGYIICEELRARLQRYGELELLPTECR